MTPPLRRRRKSHLLRILGRGRLNAPQATAACLGKKLDAEFLSGSTRSFANHQRRAGGRLPRPQLHLASPLSPASSPSWVQRFLLHWAPRTALTRLVVRSVVWCSICYLHFLDAGGDCHRLCQRPDPLAFRSSRTSAACSGRNDHSSGRSPMAH